MNKVEVYIRPKPNKDSIIKIENNNKKILLNEPL